MSWKSLVSASLLCVLASPAFAVPTLTISGSINNQQTAPVVRVWNVAVGPDLALGSPTSLALELGFQATGGNILSISAAPNMAALAAPAAARVDYDTNPGNLIFDWQPTVDIDPGAGVNMKPVGVGIGTGANTNKAWAYLGTSLLTAVAGNANNRDLLTITTDSSVTSLAWGGAYNASGVLVAPTASLQAGSLARIAQKNGATTTNYHDATYAGSLAALGTPRFLGDMNGSGSVTNADVVPFGEALNTANTYKTNRPNLNILRGDINNTGNITNADVTRFGNILNNIGITGSGSGLDSVPEPASLLLVGMVVAFASATRRRGR